MNIDYSKNKTMGFDPFGIGLAVAGLKKAGSFLTNSSMSRKQNEALKKINVLREKQSERDSKLLKTSIMFGVPAIALIAIVAIKNKKKGLQK